MKAKALLLTIALTLLGGTQKTYGCLKVYGPMDIYSFDPIYCGLEINTKKVWAFQCDTLEKVHVRYNLDMPVTSGNNHFFIYNMPLGYSGPLSFYPYFNISETDPNVVFHSDGGPSEGKVTFTSTRGWCLIILHVLNDGGGSLPYKGVRFECFTGPDTTIVSDANVTVTGSQSIMGNQLVKYRLGIGTEAPMAPLHVQLPTTNSSSRIARYQGDGTWGGASTNGTLYFDNFIRQESLPEHIQGTALDNVNTTPQTLSTWIKQSPGSYLKSISFGSGQETYMTIQNGNVGIGVEYPLYELEVNGTIKATSVITDPGGNLGNQTLNDLTVNGTSKLTGNVGIGTAPSSSYRLKVDGKAHITDNVGIGVDPSSSYRLYVSGGTSYLNGNVGIGTTPSSSYVLNVNGSIKASSIDLSNSVSIGTTPGVHKFEVGGKVHITDNVGIGMEPSTTSSSDKLRVNGIIRAREVVTTSANPNTWPDFVLAPDYQLRTLQEVEVHIKKYGRLPDIPSAAEVEEKGIALAEMNTKLLQKVEELTLYAIEQEKEIQQLKNAKSTYYLIATLLFLFALLAAGYNKVRKLENKINNKKPQL